MKTGLVPVFTRVIKIRFILSRLPKPAASGGGKGILNEAQRYTGETMVLEPDGFQYHGFTRAYRRVAADAAGLPFQHHPNGIAVPMLTWREKKVRTPLYAASGPDLYNAQNNCTC